MYQRLQLWSTCENTDYDLIPKNNDFTDHDDEKFSDALQKIDMHLSRDFFKVCYILKHTFIQFLLDIHFIQIEVDALKSKNT